MNRRDVLKLFGIGATVVPFLEGKPIVEAPAKLVSAPEVSIIEPPKPMAYGASAMSQMFNAGEPVQMHVRFTSKEGVVDLTADTFISHMNYGLVDVSSHNRQRRMLQGPGEIQWELRGLIVERPHFS